MSNREFRERVRSLKKAFDPWIRIYTWNTSHPFDEERFHFAVHKVLHRRRKSVSHREIHTAISELVHKYYTDWDAEYLEEEIEKFSTRAEYIELYLSDKRDGFPNCSHPNNQNMR